MYVKAPNIIFARHILATVQQKTGQSLREFLQNLQSLRKDSNFGRLQARSIGKKWFVILLLTD